MTLQERGRRRRRGGAEVCLSVFVVVIISATHCNVPSPPPPPPSLSSFTGQVQEVKGGGEGEMAVSGWVQKGTIEIGL